MSVDTSTGASRDDIEETFRATLSVLKTQRDTYADTVVQLSVKIMLLESKLTNQQETVLSLQKDNEQLRRENKELTRHIPAVDSRDQKHF